MVESRKPEAILEWEDLAMLTLKARSTSTTTGGDRLAMEVPGLSATTADRLLGETASSPPARAQVSKGEKDRRASSGLEGLL